MTTTWFTIDTENAIAAFPTAEEANANPNMRFAFADRSSLLTILTENEKLAEDICAGLTGLEANVSFRNAGTATRTIWEAIQVLAPTTPKPPRRQGAGARVRAAGATAALKTKGAGKKATAAKKAPKGKKAAKTSKTAKAIDLADALKKSVKAAKKAAKTPKSAKPTRASGPETATGPREGSKAAQLVAMLKRKDGATLAGIMKEFGWLAHTTRALLSAGGSLRKMGITVESFKPEGGERTYRIPA